MTLYWNHKPVFPVCNPQKECDNHFVFILSALDRPEETCSPPPQQVESKNITEEDLEDWLDSMIS